VNYLDILHAQLRVDEGVRLKPYVDTVGKISVGVGRNLTDNGISRGECALMFDNDLADAEHTARLLVPNFNSLSDVRKSVVMNMAFNMGYNVLAGFVNTLKAIEERRWNDAAAGMKASKWARQVGERAKRLEESMKSNHWKGTE
jgi:lysozyme